MLPVRPSLLPSTAAARCWARTGGPEAQAAEEHTAATRRWPGPEVQWPRQVFFARNHAAKRIVHMLQHVLRHPSAGQGSPYMQARIQGRAGSELIVRVRHCHCQGGGLPPEDRRRPNGTRTGQARGSVPQASRWCLRGCCEGARVLCELPTPPCWRLCHEDWRVPPRAARARPIGEVEPQGPVPQICVQPHATKQYQSGPSARPG